jgi:hypothetical protein
MVRVAEGEADFLVVHPERGMLVIECKGFGVRRTGTGQWLRADSHGGEKPLKESPFEQASRHKYELMKRLLTPIASGCHPCEDPSVTLLVCLPVSSSSSSKTP